MFPYSLTGHRFWIPAPRAQIIARSPTETRKPKVLDSIRFPGLFDGKKDVAGRQRFDS
jgi:hypothetical protein